MKSNMYSTSHEVAAPTGDQIKLFKSTVFKIICLMPCTVAAKI